MTEPGKPIPFVAKVLGGNKVTIPRHVVEILDLGRGDVVEATIVGKLAPRETAKSAESDQDG